MPSALKQVFLDRQHLGVDRARGFRGAEREHLDLGELVNAVEAAAGPAGGPGLGPEAMRQTHVLDRQVGLVQDLVRVHSAQGDLGGADQAEVGILDRIDLRFDPARREPDPLQDMITCQIGRDDGGKSGVDQFSDRELLERQIEQDGVVLEEVEAGAADLAAGLEIDQVEVLAELDVVLRLEVERAGRADSCGFRGCRPR